MCFAALSHSPAQDIYVIYEDVRSFSASCGRRQVQQSEGRVLMPGTSAAQEVTSAWKDGQQQYMDCQATHASNMQSLLSMRHAAATAHVARR